MEFRRQWQAVWLFGVFVLRLCAASGLAAGQAPESLYKASHPAMGTVYTIQCYMPDRTRADEVMNLAFDEIDRLEALLSNYQPSSELSRISREAGAGPVVTDPETFRFLERSQYWSERSGGAFDITVGPLLRAWGFKARSGHVPTEAEQRGLRAEVGWDKVKLDPETHTVRFTSRQPMELDPGSIGKGFAVDSVAALLRQNGVHAALISAGGSTLYGIGAPPGMTGWPVEVPDPRVPGRVATTLLLHDTSLSTGALYRKILCTERTSVLPYLRPSHADARRRRVAVHGCCAERNGQRCTLNSRLCAPTCAHGNGIARSGGHGSHPVSAATGNT